MNWRSPPRDSLCSLELPTRSHNALCKAGIDSVDRLLGMSSAKIVNVPGLGRGSLVIVEQRLAERRDENERRHQDATLLLQDLTV